MTQVRCSETPAMRGGHSAWAAARHVRRRAAEKQPAHGLVHAAGVVWRRCSRQSPPEPACPPRAPSVGSQDRTRGRVPAVPGHRHAAWCPCPAALKVCAPGSPHTGQTPGRASWRPQPASGTWMVVVPQMAVSPVLVSRSPPMPTTHGHQWFVSSTRLRPLRHPGLCRKRPEARKRSARPGSIHGMAAPAEKAGLRGPARARA